jgi:hypothetical protein
MFTFGKTGRQVIQVFGILEPIDNDSPFTLPEAGED